MKKKERRRKKHVLYFLIDTEMNWLSLCLKNSYQLTNNNYESFLGIMLTYCFVTFVFVNLALCVVVLLYLFNVCDFI